MRRRIGLQGIVAVVCLLGGSASTFAEDFKLADRVVSVEPPAGYCALDRRAPDEGVLFDVQEQTNTARALAIHVECRALDAYRAGEAFVEDLSPSVSITAGLQNGQPVIVGMQREEFNAAMEAALRSLSDEQMEALSKESGERMVATIKERLGSHYSDVEYRGLKYLGVLGRDETAVYMGTVSQLSLGGKPWTETGVAATTLINGAAITVSYAEPGDKPEAIGAVLAQVRRITRELIALNEGNL